MTKDRVLGLFLVQPLCSLGCRVLVAQGTCWINVYKAGY